MQISCKSCKNKQLYHPRITNSEINRSKNIKCKSCGNSIRINRKRIKLEFLEFRKRLIIFQTNLRKVQNKDIYINVLHNFLVIKNLEFLNFGIVDFETKEFKIFLDKFKINNRQIIYGEIKKKKYNILSHIEIYDDKINFLFREPPPQENLLSYLETCKNLSIEIQENLFNFIKIPLLVQPLDITIISI